MIAVIEVTDARGDVRDPARLAAAEAVHRELRASLPADYAATMRRIFAGGARMAVACEDDAVVGVAVYRIFETTFDGLKMYVDDLVTTASRRSTGVGHTLMEWVQARAREAGCTSFTLDSGLHRPLAHRFYFREGMYITSFSFKKAP